MFAGGRGNARTGGASAGCGDLGPCAGRAFTVVLLSALLAFGLLSRSAHAGPRETLGVYAGAANTAGVATFETTLGRSIARGHDYLDKRTWAAMTDVAWATEAWRLAGFTDRLVLTVPMLPDAGGTLAQGAAGEFNLHFRTLAEQLVARGHGSAVLRIGPEFNGFWFAWTIDVPNGGALYAAFWRQIVATMRAVPGANFKFDWCPNAGSSYVAGGGQLEAADAWPGDDVVDYVGLDVYDQSWAPHRADPLARWDEYVNQKNGMAWHAAFAAAHGKPMTFPEWGLVDRTDGMGGGDTPSFVERMYRWIETHQVAYHLYFESGDPNAQYAVFGGRFPAAATRFIEFFGTGVVPLPPPPPPPPSQPPATPAVPVLPATPAVPVLAVTSAVRALPAGTAAPTPSRRSASAAPAAGAGAGGQPVDSVHPGGDWPVPGAGGATDARPSGSTGPVSRSSSVPGGGLGARSLGRSDPAKLSIARARIMRRETALDILAPISRLASGEATVVLHSAGQRTRFTAPVDSTRGQLLIRRRITRAQAQAGTGIVTITYAGDSDTQPQEVRLRAAAQKANLALARPRLVDGRLLAAGTISSRARGIVRTQIIYSVEGVNFMREYSAPIRDGRWQLDVALAQPVLSEIDHRQGTLQSNTLFTGHLPSRMRGEMRSHEVLGE